VSIGKLGKEQQGLGVSQIRGFNIVHLGKWLWKMVVDRG